MDGPRLRTNAYTFADANLSALRTTLPPVPVDTHDPAVAVSIIVNYERSRVGAAPLAIDPLIRTAALIHAYDMARTNHLDHVGSGRSTPFDRLREAGASFGAAGEVIAAGYQGYLTVVARWLDSPPHKKILLDPTYRRIGVGVAIGSRVPKYPYWCADLSD